MTETFVCSCSAADPPEHLLVRRGRPARPRPRSPTFSPRRVVFVRSPCSFRRRRVTTAWSSVSPATNRGGAERIPYRSDEAPKPRAVRGGEDRAAQQPEPQAAWRTRSSSASSDARSSSASPRSGGRTSSRIGTPRRTSTCLSAAWRGKRSISARSAPGSTSSPRTAAATISGNAEASAETAPIGAGRQCRARSDPRSRRRRRGPRSGTPPAAPTCGPRPSSRRGCRRRSRSRPTTAGGDRVAARDRELVDVERERRAGAGGGGEVLELRSLVEREVRRRDHRDRVGAGLGGVGGECDRVGGRLRAGVDGDLETAAARPRGRARPRACAPASESRIPSPFVPSASSPSSPPAARKSATGPNPSSSMAAPPVAERRDRGGEGSRQHGARLYRPLAGEVLVVPDADPPSCRPSPSRPSGTPRRGRRPGMPFRAGAASGRGRARSPRCELVPPLTYGFSIGLTSIASP